MHAYFLFENHQPSFSEIKKQLVVYSQRAQVVSLRRDHIGMRKFGEQERKNMYVYARLHARREGC